MILCNSINPPELTLEISQYCLLKDYGLTIKKKFIVAQIISLKEDSDIDLLLLSFYNSGIKVSRSSIYAVLQWLISNDLVIKTTTGHAKNILYRANKHKINQLSSHMEILSTKDMPSDISRNA